MMTPRTSSFAALALCALLALLPAAARAQTDARESSGYTPAAGEPFFVLTDTQFGTGDEALLRVEIPASGGKETVRQFGGIDIALYRVPEPLAFLRAQKNLHRVNVKARPRDEGVANTLTYLWSNAWNQSRGAWRDLFAPNAKKSVTETAPVLKTRIARPDYRPATSFRPLSGFESVDRFRYPLMAAKPIEPPGNANLAGSSSRFIPKNESNFYVPLGKLKPGLYIAEAILGAHRATTLVFVSDTVAITKIASGTFTIWTAHRVDGRPVLGTALQWTDGQGILASATTDADGLAQFTHASPERTYLFGQDTAGGVFVSENFYYDSEIYDTKLYTVTDRPLYRPGDEVNIKFIARDYRAANQSSPAQAGELAISVYDPNGAPVWTGRAALSADRGAEAVFRLPMDSLAGGHAIRTTYRGKTYAAAFRVAEYVKPHLEIAITPGRDHFKTGEPITGAIRLTYPNGKPVKNAAVELLLRAQTLTMVQGELRYGGLFPVQLSTASLTSNDKGEARFTLPPAKEPARLVLSALVTDGAAYRVRKTRELLVERAASSWKLTSARKFSAPGETLRFRLESENLGGEEAAAPAHWEIIRLEDQTKTSGAFEGGAREWTLTLDQPGSYSLLLRDGEGNLVAAATHWVSGGESEEQGVGVIAGTIEMVTDKERYRPGETAEVLITFPSPVDEALLTLERDRVEAAALLTAARGGDANWVNAERLAPRQWRVRIPVTEAYAPNMTLSAVYIKNGEYVFQNAGLVVDTPRLALEIKTSQARVKPGETVTVDIDATLDGQATPAMLTVSVVDEMVYALQAEIAPDIVEFFQHVRRNNVRTNASLNFTTYDEAADYAADAARQPPARHQYNERGIKILERARRDDTDTAAWQPALPTDENGHARFSFKMPDALSRWRITVRAVALDKTARQDGVFGQRTAYVHSDKPLYAKWSAPVWMREGDAPIAALALFNNTDETRATEIALKLAGQEIIQKATLPRGLTYLSFKLPPFTGTRTARLEIRENGGTVDALETPLQADPPHWRGLHEQIIVLERGAAPLALPADASRLRLRLAASGAEHFLRIADALIEYPWGCVEQTASRLIPLAIAVPLLAPERTGGGKTARLWQMLYSQRQRLATLAGPNATFGWWGEGSGDNALMTAYAYYADWQAAHTLGISLPAAHWERVLDIYRARAHTEPILHRALSLWLIQQIGLPVRTQAEGLLAELTAETATTEKDDAEKDAENDIEEDTTASPILAAPDTALGLAYARVLTSIIMTRNGGKPRADKTLASARQTLQRSPHPSARALLLLDGVGNAAHIPAILAAATEATPTLERALTLAWTRQAAGGALTPRKTAAAPVNKKWQSNTAAPFGQTEWRWPAGAPLPTALRIGNAPARLTAILRYESAETGNSLDAPPVSIERRLYRLERRDGLEKGIANYAAIPVDPDKGLSAQNLYLDEIRLSSSRAYEHGIVEAPLPPGAAIEHSTWGINLIEDKTPVAIDRSRAEEHRDRYGIPVDHLPAGEPLILRHLLRVGQTGRFTLPPVRYYPMYQPARKAYADNGQTWVID
ncbi:MAG: alpha-2-macroglobulin family protein [Azoarcus sp.]|nr:alpha-2-macroglobulin family protein [Azoarcus sp.]